MKDIGIKIRNSIWHFLYLNFAKKIFFKMDPEKVHDRITISGRILGSNPLTRKFTSLLFNYSNPKLEQKIAGIKFKNPIGLAAGFDKNAELVNILPAVGFGFIEVGSITGKACKGNPKPRLWRHPESKSLRVYYGLKNEGSKIIANKLKNRKFAIPIGISIAKTNDKNTITTQQGINDYVKSLKAFKNIGNYLTINISCPNVHGGQPFTDAKKLDSLLKALNKVKYKKPVFLKLSPDLTDKELYSIMNLAKKYKITGLIATNLSKRHNKGKGGLSGKFAEPAANIMIQKISKKSKNEFIIIGCGGVFTAEDAYRKIRLGANLIQMITGMIYEGPQTISEINLGLTKLLKKDGFKTIQEAVGIDAT